MADQATTAALAAQQVAFQSIVDGQLKAFQACMQACMEANNKCFDDFVRVTISDISELKASLQFTQKELQEVKLSVNVNNDGNTAADKLLAKLMEDIKRVDDAADYMENQSRRNNLRVDGIKEKPGETWQETETALRQVVRRELKLPADQVGALQIERAHRTGGPTTTQREWTIVVKFASFKDRNTIIRAARTVKPKGLQRGLLPARDLPTKGAAPRHAGSSRARQDRIPVIRQARGEGQAVALNTTLATTCTQTLTEE